MAREKMVFVPSTGFLISTKANHPDNGGDVVFVPSTGFLISTETAKIRQKEKITVFVPSTGFLISTKTSYSYKLSLPVFVPSTGFLISTSYGMHHCIIIDESFRPLYGVPNFYLNASAEEKKKTIVFVPSTGFLISTRSGLEVYTTYGKNVFVPSTGFLISTMPLESKGHKFNKFSSPLRGS